MSKKNIFIVIFFTLITVASFATADYVEPSSSAPNNNVTKSILKTVSNTGTDSLYEKLGTGNGNLYPELIQLTNGSYFGVTDNGTKYGLFSDKSVVTGNTIVSENFNIMSDDLNDPFDQYSTQFTYASFPSMTNTTAKKLEALINGRFVTKNLLISNSNNTGAPNYGLELRPANGFNPTTNIGLGNSCKIYPLDMGATVGAFGTGCPTGSYMSMYKGPSFSGTLSSSNNTNNQLVAQCTYFKPSASPTNNTNCYSSGVTLSHNSLAFHGSSLPGIYSMDPNPSSPGNCILKARISATQLKNPILTIKDTTSSTTLFGPQSVTQVNNLSFNCTHNIGFTITDDYGQYYNSLTNTNSNDPDWGYTW